MARSVKKIKRAKSKKFWIIFSSVLGVLIVGSIVGFLIWYCEYNTADLTNLFSEYTQYKINYNELEKIIDNSKGEYKHNKMFVFVYNNNYVIDEPDCDKTSTEYQTYLNYKEATEELKDLMGLIEKINKAKADADQNDSTTSEVLTSKEYEIGFYMVNTSISVNEDLAENDDYDSLTSPAMLTFMEGKVNDSTTYDKLTYIKSSVVVSSGETGLSGGSTALDFTYTIKTIRDYLNQVYSSYITE